MDKEGFKKVFKGVHKGLDYSDIGFEKSAKYMDLRGLFGCRIEDQKETIYFSSGMLENRLMVNLDSMQGKDPGSACSEAWSIHSKSNATCSNGSKKCVHERSVFDFNFRPG